MTFCAILAVHPNEGSRWYPVRETPNASLCVCVGKHAGEDVIVRVGVGRVRDARSTQVSALEHAVRFASRERALRACELLRGAFPAYSFRVYEVPR